MDALDEGQELLLAARWREAVSAFDRAVSEGSADPVGAFIGRAIALRFLGRTEDALDDLNLAVSRDPRRADAYHERAIALVMLGRDGEALNDLDRAIAMQSTAQRLSDRGGIHVRQRRYVDAVADLRSAVALQPDLAEAHYNLGSAQASSGDLRGAASSFSHAHRLGLARAEAKLLRARQELLIAASNDGSTSLAIEALFDARSSVDVSEALDRFPFMALPEFIESLEGGLVGLPSAEASALALRIDALKQIADQSGP